MNFLSPVEADAHIPFIHLMIVLLIELYFFGFAVFSVWNKICSWWFFTSNKSASFANDILGHLYFRLFQYSFKLFVW